MKKILYLLAILSIITGCSRKESVECFTLSADSQLRYTAIMSGRTPKAYILLFPGFGESPEDVLASTDLPYQLARQNIAVFIPILQNGSESYGFSNESQENIAKIVTAICDDIICTTHHILSEVFQWEEQPLSSLLKMLVLSRQLCLQSILLLTTKDFYMQQNEI